MWKILVVDDNASNREAVRTLLQDEGYQAMEAADGAEGLRVAEKEQPQLVISDILMPSMDGYEFVRQLRANPKLAQIAVIFYTANYHRLEANNLAAQCGVAQVIVKPCSAQELLGAVADVLSGTSRVVVPQINEKFDRDHLQLLTDKLSNKADELTALNSRFAALTELNVQLALGAGSACIVGTSLCRRTQSTRCQVFIPCDRRSSRVQSTESVDERIGALRRTPAHKSYRRRAPRGGIPKALPRPRVTVGKGLRESGAGYSGRKLCVAVPISSLTRTYGWLVPDRQTGIDPIRCKRRTYAEHLGRSVGRIYENGSLYREVQEHAAQLLVEMEERGRASEKLRDSEMRFSQLVENIDSVFLSLRRICRNRFT